MKHMTVAIMGIAALLVGCGADGAAEPTPSPPSPSVNASASSPSGDEASALEGTWETGTVAERDIEKTLREAGLEKWIEPLRALPASAPPTDSNVFALEIHAGAWNLYWEPDGGAGEPIDFDSRYKVDGNTVVVSHEGDSNTYRWSVDGDTLRLTWVDTTYGSYKGIPEEVFQRAFYMSGEFKKVE
jgi:hypothetical protein